tara:strand:+ start:1204 stop:2874 length:1671 start_codon:yes stop_codon:yes gene_type:complete
MPTNEFKIGTDAYLDRHFRPILIGDEVAPLELSTEEFKINGNTTLEGDLNIEGSVYSDFVQARDLEIKGGEFTIYQSGSTTNYARFLFSATTSVLLGATDLNIDAGGDLMLKADGNSITWYGGSGVSNVWTLSTDGITMGGYDTSNRGYTFATTGTGDLKFEAGSGSFLIKEVASAGADTAAYGQLWVKNESPNELYFTNDAGNDIQITDGSSMAGGGGGASALNDLSDVSYSSGDLEISSLDKIVLSADLHIDSSEDKIYLDVTKDGSNPCGIYNQKAGTTFQYTTCQYNLSGTYWQGDEGADTGMGWVSVGADGVMSIGTYDGFGNVADVKISADGMIKNENGATYYKERASAWTDVASYGQLWVKTATPNELYFTTDAGDDIQLTSGTSTAGGSSTQYWDKQIGGYKTNNNSTTVYYTFYRFWYENWSNGDSSISSLSYTDSYSCFFIAPRAGTITNIKIQGTATDTGATDPFKFYFYKSAMSSDTTAVSLTAMFNTSAITPPTANRTWTHTEDFSSSNTFAENDMLFVYLKKDSTSGNQDLFWNMNLNGEYS